MTETDLPLEERLLSDVDWLRKVAANLLSATSFQSMRRLDRLEAYLQQAINDRDHPNPWDCDHDTEGEWKGPFDEPSS